jgi:hypothetical protein
MLDCGLLTPSQTKSQDLRRAKARIDGEMDLTSLFIGFEPDDIFGRLVSIDMAELLIVFSAIAFTVGVMVIFGNWWSR